MPMLGIPGYQSGIEAFRYRTGSGIGIWRTARFSRILKNLYEGGKGYTLQVYTARVVDRFKKNSKLVYKKCIVYIFV
jgi:hypothetical protein